MGPGRVTVQGDIPLAQRNALVDIYTATNGPGWTVSTNWLSGDPCTASWALVSCTGATIT